MGLRFKRISTGALAAALMTIAAAGPAAAAPNEGNTAFLMISTVLSCS